MVFQETVAPLQQKQEYMQNSIIGRKEEIALLEKYMASNHSEFIAVYGRRVESFRVAIQTHYGIAPTLITTFGLSRGMCADSIHASVVLDDLFSN